MGEEMEDTDDLFESRPKRVAVWSLEDSTSQDKLVR